MPPDGYHLVMVDQVHSPLSASGARGMVEITARQRAAAG